VPNANGPKESCLSNAQANPPTFQDLIFSLQQFWAERGCVIQQPYDLEVGAGTMAPETFLRVLGPKPYHVAYVQPSRRPADGRYGDNPNRLYKHTQLQVILKPPPENVQDLYLESLAAIGIDLRRHDIKFEEDNWESPTLGAWGIGWQVMLDGLEITQFTYFQQCGGQDLDPISAELTYGLERIAAFLQDVDSVYDITWAPGVKYRDVRHAEELQFSVYNFEAADVEALWKHLELCESECRLLLPPKFTWESGENWIRWLWNEFSVRVDGRYIRIREGSTDRVVDYDPGNSYSFAVGLDVDTSAVHVDLEARFREHKGRILIARGLRAQTPKKGEFFGGESPARIAGLLPLPALDLCLKCSHLFNILDSRGAISVTERVGVIARIRNLAVGIAKAYLQQQDVGTSTLV
jgi:glycyl-tRNA synthetase alpha chain